MSGYRERLDETEETAQPTGNAKHSADVVDPSSALTRVDGTESANR
jgi:hypothetical protein